MVAAHDDELITLPPRRAGRAPDSELLTRREAIAELSGPGDITFANFGEIDCAIAEPATAKAIILHCHGGGFRHGTARGWAGFAQRLATAAEARVIVPEYSLAPEHPFPAAIHEILAALTAVIAQASPLPLFLAGDSAGGGLALAVTNLLPRPLPLGGLILISPWLDLRLQAGSYTRSAATDAIFSRDSAAISAEAYLQGAPCDHPLASPLLGRLKGLPPVQVQASGAEVLLDDSFALAERLAVTGVLCELHIEPGVPHVWPVPFPDLPASRRALARIGGFIDAAQRSG